MSFGQKTKRFFLKLLALILALAILAGSVSCALVYFDLADIPFIEKVMGLFGYEKEEPEDPHFASIPGKFTDEQIVLLTAFAGMLIATNLINNALEVELDDCLQPYTKR